MYRPAITVLMSVFNGDAHLDEAISSILAQTETEFEFIIIDDGSTDATHRILDHHNRKDKRIHVIRNERNMGLAASLNKGLSMARCELIARMDADDVSLPHRLKRQLNFMKAHPDITVCGSYLRSHSRPRQILAFPIDDPSIRATLLFENCIAHPSVILRRSPVLELIQGYSAEYLAAQDYVLWARLCEHESVRFATLPEPLLSYRITDASSRSPYKQLQTDISDTARKIILSNLGLACTPEQWRCHQALSLHQPARDGDFLRCCGQWLMDLRRANACVAAFDPGGLETEFHRRWRAICLRSARRLRFSGRIFLSESQEGATIRNLFWALMMRAKSLACGA